jgi:hypothetical protein
MSNNTFEPDLLMHPYYRSYNRYSNCLTHLHGSYTKAAKWSSSTGPNNFIISSSSVGLALSCPSPNSRPGPKPTPNRAQIDTVLRRRLIGGINEKAMLQLFAEYCVGTNGEREEGDLLVEKV